MFEGWKARLRALTDRFRRGTETHAVDAPAGGPPLQLNLGIDFGTRFTKVCIRDAGTDLTRVVSFRSGLACPSVVVVARSGTLRALGSRPSRDGETEVPYLKMRLAGMAIEGGPALAAGHDLTDPAVMKALSSWYLADLITKCKRWVANNESERIRNRTVQWTANVGVPVAHYDSPALDTFKEVLAVAWLWQNGGDLPSDIRSAVTRYRETRAEAISSPCDCQPVPEIAAAVQSFVTSREAVPDRYIYVDIGGGTVDAVVFQYTNSPSKRVNFFAGEVKPLGTEPLLKACGLPLGEEGLTCLTKNSLNSPEVPEIFKAQLENLLGSVLMTAKSKDNALPWSEHIRDGTGPSYVGSLELSQMKPLRIFIGGGGSRIPWFKDVLLGAWRQQKLKNFGFPPFQLLEVPCPKELSLAAEKRREYHRLSVAYGLSVPLGEGPEVGLPSQFERTPPMPEWSPRVGSYLDSKDAYD